MSSESELESDESSLTPASSVGLRQKSLFLRLKELSVEGKLNFVVLVSVAIYSLVYIHQESTIISGAPKDKASGLSQGWNVISRKQDVADFEWFFWFSEARDTLISVLGGHFVISVLADFVMPQRKTTCLLLFEIVAVFYLFGPVFIVWFLVITTVYFYIALHRSAGAIILLSSSLLLALHQLPLAKYQLLKRNLDYTILVRSALTFTVFRCCSFSLESIKNPLINVNFMDILHYNLYLPFFFFGPVMTYNVFIEQKSHLVRASVRKFVVELFWILFYILAVDCLRHFLYVSSLPSNGEFMEKAPVIVIGFLAFSNFYLDWIKGRILYGVSSGMAQDIDGYRNAPICCKNVATIKTFADTYFDRGLQDFICRYVYDPLSENHQHLVEEALAGAASFVVVIASQGVTMQVLLWAFLNWFGLTLEFYLTEKFSNSANQRAVAVFYGLNYWAIILFNSIAINGIKEFQLYSERLFISSFPGTFLTIAVGYCYIRINMELQRKTIKVD